MATTVSKGTLFPESLLPDLIQKTTGESALATLCPSIPVPFSGQKEFTFSLDNEIDLVTENGAFSAGGATVGSVTVLPMKVEYGARVSAEFMDASEAYKLDVLTAFSDGFAKKLGRGLDIMAFHGLNPRTKTAASTIGNNCFAKAVTNAVTMSSTSNADANVEDAVELVQSQERDVTGIIMAPQFRSELSKLTDKTGRRLYPDLSWGTTPGSLNGLMTRSSANLAFNQSLLRAVVGDFSYFRWGYAKQISMEVIPYGNPDNDQIAGDLKGHDQVYIRAIAHIGFTVLDPAAFALIKAAAAESSK